MVENFKNNLINAVVENYPYPHIHLKSVFGDSNKEILEKLGKKEKNTMIVIN